MLFLKKVRQSKLISIVTAPKESVQKFTNSSIKIGFKKFVWNIPIKSLVYGRSLSPDIYKKYYTHMLKMAPFLTHIFMESWPCFFEIRVPTNGNICQSHFSNVNEMDGAAFSLCAEIRNQGSTEIGVNGKVRIPLGSS